MIAYLDTSALVPLIVAEPSSGACRLLWDEADDVATSRLTYAETAAALAQAVRLDRLTSRAHRTARRALDELWTELDVVEVDEELAGSAADVARRLALRGYDAVQCASALALDHSDLVAASGDRSLLTAWNALGLSTYDTNDQPG